MKALKFSEEVVQIKKQVLPRTAVTGVLSRSMLSGAIKPFWTPSTREAYRSAAAPITGRTGAYGRLWSA